MKLRVVAGRPVTERGDYTALCEAAKPRFPVGEFPKRAALAAVATATLLALWPLTAKAELYGLVSIGKARFGNPAQLWHDFQPITQYGYSSIAMEESNTWALGLGKRYRWGAIEATVQDFGETKSYAGYPYDEGDPGLPAGCVYPCTAPQWVYHYGTAQGITISALPEFALGRNAAIFARAGATFYRATFEYHIADTERYHDARHAIAQKWKPTYGIAPAFGIGLRLGPVSLEATRHHGIEALGEQHDSGSFQRIDTMQLTYRVPL